MAKSMRHDLREDHCQRAEAICYGDAERDQREHVEAARAQRTPAALQQRRAAPEDDRSGQRKLQPAADRAGQRTRQATEHAAHRQRQQRHGEYGRPSEPPPHVDQFRIVAGRCHRHGALERHAAPGAGAGDGALDARAHRTDVEHFARCQRAGSCRHVDCDAVRGVTTGSLRSGNLGDHNGSGAGRRGGLATAIVTGGMGRWGVHPPILVAPGR